jgi:hypothetical protein
LDPKESESLAQKELSTDKSSSGHLSSIAAEVCRPDIDLKKRWLNDILTKTDLPVASARKALRNLLPRNQQDLRGELADFFFAHLPNVAFRDDSRLQELYVHLGPFDYTEARPAEHS